MKVYVSVDVERISGITGPERAVDRTTESVSPRYCDAVASPGVMSTIAGSIDCDSGAYR